MVETCLDCPKKIVYIIFIFLTFSKLNVVKYFFQFNTKPDVHNRVIVDLRICFV